LPWCPPLPPLPVRALPKIWRPAPCTPYSPDRHPPQDPTTDTFLFEILVVGAFLFEIPVEPPPSRSRRRPVLQYPVAPPKFSRSGSAPKSPRSCSPRLRPQDPVRPDLLLLQDPAATRGPGGTPKSGSQRPSPQHPAAGRPSPRSHGRHPSFILLGVEGTLSLSHLPVLLNRWQWRRVVVAAEAGWWCGGRGVAWWLVVPA
jgi:hypothetical protein